ncbi:MAG: protein kinase [Planctomycetota bacterium]
MAPDLDKRFLKLALSNELISPEDAEKVLVARAERLEIGVERSASEIAVELGLLSESQSDMLMSTLRDLAPPKQIGGFEVLDEIGKGAVGTVYRARQVSLDKIVALKVMHQNRARDESFVEQFELEGRAAGKINHPHVVTAIDAGHADGYHYLAMELVEGQSLKAQIDAAGPLEEAAAIDLARAVAQGLANAHGHGLLHRDLKPDNILMGRDGSVKIGDFGLAMPLDDADLMSVERQRMGTPYYLSPEQAQGKGLSEASDIYSLGSTLYFTVTGKPPFTGASLKEILKKAIHQPPVPPTEVEASIGPLFESLIVDCLAKDPAERVSSARDFLERLEAVDQIMRQPADTSRPAPRSRKRAASPPSGGPKRPQVPRRTGTPPPPKPPAKPSVKSAGGPKRPAAATRKKPPRQEVLGAAPAAPSRAFAPKRKSVFTMAGGGLGGVLAIIFVLTAIKANSQEAVEAEKSEKVAVSAEIQRDTIKWRLGEWNNDIKSKGEKLSKQLLTIETSAKTDRLRLDALFNMIDTHPESTAVPEIVTRIDAIRAAAKGTLFAGVQQYLDVANRLESEGRTFDALMSLDRIPTKLTRQKEIDELIGQRIKELSDKIDLDHAADQGAIKVALSKKDYDAAIVILQRVIKYADEDKVRDAETRLAQLQKDKASLAKAEASRRKQEEANAYAALIPEYKRLCDQRNFTECISKAITLLEQSTTPEVKAQLESDLQAFQLLDGFLNDALAWYADQESKGTEVRLEKTNEDIVVGTSAGFKREGDEVTLMTTVKRGGGTAVQFTKLADIVDATIFTMVEEKHGPRAAAYVVPLGILFTYRQRFDIAERHFQLAQEYGITPTQWLEKLEYIRKQQ